jgi:hypothetical protein
MMDCRVKPGNDGCAPCLAVRDRRATMIAAILKSIFGVSLRPRGAGFQSPLG